MPISGRPGAIADLGSLSGDLDRLARGRKARVQLEGAGFTGPVHQLIRAPEPPSSSGPSGSAGSTM
jgi:hypothetical protein